ncbi:MAG: hypothetical protein UW94_C0013G0007 [Parcubacteria group bacterium GW2011_GWA2_45_14]|nr:MAG: hypothetical protein UW94_C0013G0007 [Parcubacteria group bacterium GW2011_GWA2_45_14]
MFWGKDLGLGDRGGKDKLFGLVKKSSLQEGRVLTRRLELLIYNRVGQFLFFIINFREYFRMSY